MADIVDGFPNPFRAEATCLVLLYLSVFPAIFFSQFVFVRRDATIKAMMIKKSNNTHDD